jgi:hypothetical protein
MGDLSALNHGAPGDTVVQTPRATCDHVSAATRAPTHRKWLIPETFRSTPNRNGSRLRGRGSTLKSKPPAEDQRLPNL